MNSYSILKTPLGDLLLVANETELTGIYFNDCRHVPKMRSKWTLDKKHRVLLKAEKELKEFFEGKRAAFSFAPSNSGTDFQKRVWREIAKIPFGKTITYGELAKKAGRPAAIRAAGAATGRNPLSIVIPCHRVMGKNGKITGYAGGLPRKEYLLKLEEKFMRD